MWAGAVRTPEDGPKQLAPPRCQREHVPRALPTYYCKMYILPYVWNYVHYLDGISKDNLCGFKYNPPE